MENQLQTIVKSSGLDQTKANYILTQFQDYFRIAAEWEAKAKTIVVTDESQKPEMQMARTGRLFLREKRIAIEKARKSLKEQALREGKAIDGIANVLKALIEPIEKYLEEQEKFVEIKAAKEAELKRIEEEKKAEAERLEQEKREKAQEERRNRMFELGLKWDGASFIYKDINFHWIDILTMTDKDFEKAYEGAKARKTQIEKEEAEEQERIRIENEKLKKEAEEREQKAREEREKMETEKKALEEKARKEKEDAEQKAKEREKKLKEQASREVDKVKKELQKESQGEIECPYCHRKFSLNIDNRTRMTA